MKFLDLVFSAVVNWTLLMLVREGSSSVSSSAASAAAATTADGQGEGKVALLIIDVQDCFLPGGSLAVTDGEQVIPVINRIRTDYADQLDTVVVSQDWHCFDHVSFASQHPGAQPYSLRNLTYNAKGELCYGPNVAHSYPHAVSCGSGSHVVVSQTMWPDHCIQNVTSGPTSAEFSPLLTLKPTDIVIRKGNSCGVDSYSAFYDNGGFHQTALDGVLKERGVGVVVVTGLALDYCVYFTSKDAHRLGYKVLTVTDASRGVANSTTEAALQDMRNTGVELVTEATLGDALHQLTGAAGRLSGLSFVYLLLLTTIVVTSASSQ